MSSSKWFMQGVMLIGVLVLAAIVSQWAGQVARATGSQRLAEAHRHAAMPTVIAAAEGLDGKVGIATTGVTGQGPQ